VFAGWQTAALKAHRKPLLWPWPWGACWGRCLEGLEGFGGCLEGLEDFGAFGALVTLKKREHVDLAL